MSLYRSDSNYNNTNLEVEDHHYEREPGYDHCIAHGLPPSAPGRPPSPHPAGDGGAAWGLSHLLRVPRRGAGGMAGLRAGKALRIGIHDSSFGPVHEPGPDWPRAVQARPRLPALEAQGRAPRTEIPSIMAALPPTTM